MSRLWIALLAVAAGGAAGIASDAAGAAPQRPASPPASSLRTVAPVSLLAADGTLAAAVVPGNGGSRCTQILLWRAGSQRPTRVVTQVGCGRGGPLEGLTELALGGERVMWQETNGGNNLELIVNTATLARPTPVQLSYVENGSGAAGEPGGSYTGNLDAHGDLLVFGRWTHCDRSGGGYSVACKLGVPELSGGALHRVAAGEDTVLRRGDDVSEPLWVDGGRVLVRRPDSTLALLRTTGATLRTFAVTAGSGEALFQGTRLAVLRPAALDVYDTATGRRVRSFALAQKPRRLVDLQSGIAVLVTGGAVHLVRLDTGRGATVVPKGGGTVQAQLEPDGLFTSSAAGLAFLPMPAVLKRLGAG